MEPRPAFQHAELLSCHIIGHPPASDEECGDIVINVGISPATISYQSQSFFEGTNSKAQLYSALPISAERKIIRLLEVIDPGGFVRNHEIRGRLKVVSLDDGPSFAALSHTWGQW